MWPEWAHFQLVMYKTDVPKPLPRTDVPKPLPRTVVSSNVHN